MPKHHKSAELQDFIDQHYVLLHDESLLLDSKNSMTCTACLQQHLALFEDPDTVEQESVNFQSTWPKRSASAQERLKHLIFCPNTDESVKVDAQELDKALFEYQPPTKREKRTRIVDKTIHIDPASIYEWTTAYDRSSSRPSLPSKPSKRLAALEHRYHPAQLFNQKLQTASHQLLQQIQQRKVRDLKKSINNRRKMLNMTPIPDLPPIDSDEELNYEEEKLASTSKAAQPDRSQKIEVDRSRLARDEANLQRLTEVLQDLKNSASEEYFPVEDVATHADLPAPELLKALQYDAAMYYDSRMMLRPSKDARDTDGTMLPMMEGALDGTALIAMGIFIQELVKHQVGGPREIVEMATAEKKIQEMRALPRGAHLRQRHRRPKEKGPKTEDNEQTDLFAKDSFNMQRVVSKEFVTSSDEEDERGGGRRDESDDDNEMNDIKEVNQPLEIDSSNSDEDELETSSD